MKYYINISDGKVTEVAKADENFTAATGEITREEYDGLILGIRTFLNSEDSAKVAEDLMRDGYYDN